MKFAPRPKNEFKEFMTLYYESCRQKIPQIQALAAKWDFDDLIPGLSDYDMRLIYKDGMTVDDWCSASMAIGEVHLDICTKYPRWARILEHLPGINLTWQEFMDNNMYYPEYQQWTIYKSEDPEKLKESKKYLADHKWDEQDEYFFLKRFLVFYGSYDREIDPAINLGTFENKYPLHSRLMHYFNPPVQAAVSILLKKVIRGKIESIGEAKKLFPKLQVLNELIDVVEKHYEVPQLYEEPYISQLETRLFSALKEISRKLAEHITIIDDAEKKIPSEWKRQLADSNPSSVFLRIFDSTKWARQMRGRLYFYANAPEHFDSQWCIGNELNRINNMFFVVPYKTFWEFKTGQNNVDSRDVVEKLRGGLLTNMQADCTIEYHNLTARKWPKEKYKEVALKIVDVYEDFYRGLYKLVGQIKGLSTKDAR